MISAGLQFIIAQDEEGAARVTLCRQAPPVPPRLLEINGGGANSQQPVPSPRTNQCDHEKGERGIVSMESKFTVGELVRSSLLYFLP